jgi:hypothetical protein
VLVPAFGFVATLASLSAVVALGGVFPGLEEVAALSAPLKRGEHVAQLVELFHVNRAHGLQRGGDIAQHLPLA